MNSSKLKPILLITLIFCGVSVILFNIYGVKNVYDSQRYLDYANNIKQGFYFDERNFWYLGYVLFVFLTQQISDSELVLVIFQNLWSLVAVLSLYQTSLLLSKNPKGAVLVSLAYILFIEILSWNSYILCESIYISNTCISLFLLVFIYKKRPYFGFYILTGFFILFTALTKPTGIALIAALSFVLLIKIWKRLDNRIFRFAMVLCSFVIFLLLINKMLTAFTVIENYKNGEIVFGINSLPDKPAYENLRIVPPNDLYIPPQNAPPLTRILSFMVHNPLFWAKLFFKKIYYFLINIRPYWSWRHIIYNLLFLMPVYFYGIRGIVNQRYPKEVVVFALTYFFIHVIGIGMTFLDWDSRFIMPLLPVLFLLASEEFARDYDKIVAVIRNKNLISSFRKR